MKSSGAKSPRYVTFQTILTLVVLTSNIPDSLGLDSQTLARSLASLMTNGLVPGKTR